MSHRIKPLVIDLAGTFTRTKIVCSPKGWSDSVTVMQPKNHRITVIFHNNNGKKLFMKKVTQICHIRIHSRDVKCVSKARQAYFHHKLQCLQLCLCVPQKLCLCLCALLRLRLYRDLMAVVRQFKCTQSLHDARLS